MIKMSKNMIKKRIHQDASNVELNQTKTSALDLSDNCSNNYVIENHNSLKIEIEKNKLNRNEKNEKLKGEVEKQEKKRNPKCAKCGNHKIDILVKGHKRKCKYKDCPCKQCKITVEKRKLMAENIHEKRKQQEDLQDGTYKFPDPVLPKDKTDGDSDKDSTQDSYCTTKDSFDNEIQSKFPKIKKELLSDCNDKHINKDQLMDILVFTYMRLEKKRDMKKIINDLETNLKLSQNDHQISPMRDRKLKTNFTISTPPSSNCSDSPTAVSTEKRHLSQPPCPPWAPPYGLHPPSTSILSNSGLSLQFYYNQLLGASLEHKHIYLPGVNGF